jgi:hypothetical protein
MVTLASRPVYCPNTTRHGRKPPLIGRIAPREGYGRLYLRCRCGTWWPVAPPVHDPDLHVVRCQRSDLETFGRRLRENDAHTPHGEELAQIALASDAILIIRCPRNRHIVNGRAMVGTTLHEWFYDAREEHEMERPAGA